MSIVQLLALDYSKKCQQLHHKSVNHSSSRRICHYAWWLKMDILRNKRIIHGQSFLLHSSGKWQTHQHYVCVREQRFVHWLPYIQHLEVHQPPEVALGTSRRPQQGSRFSSQWTAEYQNWRQQFRYCEMLASLCHPHHCFEFKSEIIDHFYWYCC